MEKYVLDGRKHNSFGKLKIFWITDWLAINY